METLEASAFEQTILKLGLVNEGQLAEIHEEIGGAPNLQHLIAALERKSYLTPWQRGKVLKGDVDGFILGGYKLLYKIQSGSFGRVYRAVDPRDGRVVAVKVLRRRWSENEQRIEMFIREGKVGLMLEHPNIVKVLAINRDPSSGQYYIVMEFVEGGNLREILQIRKNLSVAESLGLIEDCANGLAYAYSRGMTHRDIKLTNILLSDTREAKLVDFGLAHFFSTMARREEEKVDRTVDYAGLERATDVKTGDIRSDIYFLGCVLYECLTGRPPLVMTRDKHARMRKGRFEEVRPIHPSEIDGPPSVLMLVETMMALDPKDRYQTPSQLLDAVRKVRREAEGKSSNDDDRPPTRSVFLVEPDEGLQGAFRDKLKDQGYRVFLAGDPMRARDRFYKQPFDGLIVDARTTGEEGLRVFELIIDEAARRRLRCAAMLLLDEEQADWAAQLPTGPHISVIIGQNIMFKTVSHTLKELMEAAHDSKVLPALIRPVLPPPPAPAPRVVEAPPREEAAPPPPVPAVRVVEVPPRKEAAPPPPRREPIPASTPAAFSPPPPPEETAPPAFMGFSVMTVDDLLPPPEETAPPPPQREPMAASVPAPPREEASPPPPPTPAPRVVEAPPPPREEAAPPPRREPKPASAPDLPRLELPTPRREPKPAAFSPPPPHEEDIPLLASEEGILLPPPEEAAPPPRRKETASPSRRQEAAPPRRQEIVPPPRRSEPRRQTNPPPMTPIHVPHEDPLAPPDTHSWRNELGVPEKKERESAWIRLRNFWTALTPAQKSGIGLALLALVVVLFFTNMISDMIIQSKFDKIQEGMSVEEVEKILGGPGKKVVLGPGPKAGPKGRNKDQGHKDPSLIVPETWTWEVGNKKFMILFSNGRMTEKQIQER